MSYNSINSLSSSPLRLTGMASGLDTDSIINDLMKIEQLKVDKVFKQKVKAEWRKEALTDTRNKLRTFRETYASALSADKNMYTSSVYMKYKVSISSTASVEISTSSSAREGSYTVNEIKQLAETAKVNSVNVINTVPGQYTALKNLDLATPLEFEDGKISFKINGETFEFSEEDTLKTMTDRINSSAANVNIYFSGLSKGLHIETKATGADQALNIENLTGNAFGENSAFGIDNVNKTGKNAILKINGFDVEQNTNKFTFDGVTYELKAQTSVAVNFNVTRDVQYTVDKIKDFVNQYNDFIGSLDSLINQDKFYDYEPLTDQQKEDMKDEEIEKWEGKAKSGLLKNDTAISSLLSTLRASIYKKVEGTGLALCDIGITTGSYLERGKLVVDEKKLAKYITERPEDVMNLFMATTQASAEISAAEKYEKDGFFTRMGTTFNNYYDTLNFDKMDENIRDYEDRIKALETRLYESQERYYRQFAQLESALTKMQSQSSWLAQQFTTN